MKKLLKKFLLRTIAFILGFSKIYKARLLSQKLLPQETNPKNLMHIYQHAKKNIPYYQKNLPEIKEEPANFIKAFQNLKFTLEKQVLKEDIYQIMDPAVIKHTPVVQYKDNPIKSFLKILTSNTLVPINTGGSTGSPLHFFKTKEIGLKMLTTLLQIAHFHGWEEGEPLISIWQKGMYSQLDFLNKIAGLLGAPLFTFRQIDTNTAKKFTQTLNKINPSVIFAFPSYLSELVSKMKMDGYKVEKRPKFVLCAGEMLFDHQRKIIEDFFGCKVYQFYGSMEIGFVALECSEQRGFHVLEEYCFLENDENNNIITTPLDMYYMPLIKFNTGDRGVIAVEKCSCGIQGKIIRTLEGRIEEYLLNGQGEKVYASYLRQVILEMNEKFENAILRVQFVQKKSKDLEFSLQLFSQDYEKDLVDTIKNRLEKDLGVKTSGQIVETLLQEKGKFKFLIRE